MLVEREIAEGKVGLDSSLWRHQSSHINFVSIGFFRWVPTKSGEGFKKSKVFFRYRGPVSLKEQLLAHAVILADRIEAGWDPGVKTMDFKENKTKKTKNEGESTPTPIVQALTQIMGKAPPSEIVWGCYYDFRPLGDSVIRLQDWCAMNAPIRWMTGLGALEAAELLVQGAIENGNLPSSPEE